MELIRGLHNLRPRHRGCVATIGNFDGVHLGHQEVLGQLAERAGGLGLPTTLITFEPQPLEYFAPERAPARLTRLREKLQALWRFSVDRVLLLPFNRQLAEKTAAEFIQQILVDGLAVKYLVVGDDFRFGRGREGDFDTLVSAGAQHGFQVVNMHTYSVDGERVSSTRVREALNRGDMRAAERLLGRHYRMSGRVRHGDRLGRELGFPTANIWLHRQVTPLEGIFAVEVFGLEREPLAAVASIGNRPTVDGTRTILEVYIFDFDAEIYGHYLQVSFLHKLRDQLKFDSLEALREQIARDVQDTREFFRQYYAG
ncbi:MAG TPA: bifunctional riboflavin kinase/FAD synthetase [Gammaproteobacteria bacterium]|nr:bifunctional riboflavin kinase/FAD synthetase [Gammaproteobacteria bacterium]